MVFKLERKPTSHTGPSSVCISCRKEIGKSEWRFMIASYGYKHSDIMSYHPQCLFDFLVQELQRNKLKIKKGKAFVRGFSTAAKLMNHGD